MKPDWIDLDGTANTRDTGGLPDGRRAPHGQPPAAPLGQPAGPVARPTYGAWSTTTASGRSSTCGRIEVAAKGPGPMTREPLVTVTHLSLFPEQDDTKAAGGPAAVHVGRGFAGLYLGFLRRTARLGAGGAAARRAQRRRHPGALHRGQGPHRHRGRARPGRGGRRARRRSWPTTPPRPNVSPRCCACIATAAADGELAAAALEHAPRAVTMERLPDALDGGRRGRPWLAAHGWTGPTGPRCGDKLPALRVTGPTRCAAACAGRGEAAGADGGHPSSRRTWRAPPSPRSWTTASWIMPMPWVRPADSWPPWVLSATTPPSRAMLWPPADEVAPLRRCRRTRVPPARTGS